jgi:hypothetical protein
VAEARPSNVINVRELYVRSEEIFQALKENSSRRYVVTRGGRRSNQGVAVLLSWDEYERLRQREYEGEEEQ